MQSLCRSFGLTSGPPEVQKSRAVPSGAAREPRPSCSAAGSDAERKQFATKLALLFPLFSVLDLLDFLLCGEDHSGAQHVWTFFGHLGSEIQTLSGLLRP